MQHYTQGDAHIIAADDISPSIFNTGVLLVKNSEWSRDFFADVLRMGQTPEVRNHGEVLSAAMRCTLSYQWTIE